MHHTEGPLACPFILSHIYNDDNHINHNIAKVKLCRIDAMQFSLHHFADIAEHVDCGWLVDWRTGRRVATELRTVLGISISWIEIDFMISFDYLKSSKNACLCPIRRSRTPLEWIRSGPTPAVERCPQQFPNRIHRHWNDAANAFFTTVRHLPLFCSCIIRLWP